MYLFHPENMHDSIASIQFSRKLFSQQGKDLAKSYKSQNTEGTLDLQVIYTQIWKNNWFKSQANSVEIGGGAAVSIYLIVNGKCLD